MHLRACWKAEAGIPEERQMLVKIRSPIETLLNRYTHLIYWYLGCAIEDV